MMDAFEFGGCEFRRIDMREGLSDVANGPIPLDWQSLLKKERTAP